jgi:hypothetical protein
MYLNDAVAIVSFGIVVENQNDLVGAGRRRQR